MIYGHSLGGLVVLEALQGVTDKCNVILDNPAYLTGELIRYKYLGSIVINIDLKHYFSRIDKINNKNIKSIIYKLITLPSITFNKKALTGELLDSIDLSENSQAIENNLRFICNNTTKYQKTRHIISTIIGKKDLLIPISNKRRLILDMNLSNEFIYEIDSGHTTVLENLEVLSIVLSKLEKE